MTRGTIADLRSVLGKTRRYLNNPCDFLRSLQGSILAHALKKSDQPMMFTDRAGFKYWQYPGDNLRLAWERRSVTDSGNVIRYVLGNVQPGGICVDVGAHIGAISVPLWSRVGANGKVVSVEAYPDTIERLKANLRLNGYRDDYVVNAALTDRSGVLGLRCYPKSSGWQTLGEPSFARDHESYVLDVKAIDFMELAETQALSTIDFVKLDVEGAEPLVLAGMRSLLRRKLVRCLVFEVNPLMLEGMGRTPQDLFSCWDGLDYELRRLGSDGALRPLERRWPENVVGDCVALPRER